jgi:glycosyltransferase involved in cell wall biosynthesis
MALDTQPKVSVIITTYNRAGMLSRAIRSVLEQTFDNLECIIVDDASTDNTKSVVEGFVDKRVIYLQHERQEGASAARNTGIKNASGGYIAYLDSDDEWLPDKLSKQVTFLENCSKKIGVVNCTHYSITYDHPKRRKINKAVLRLTGDVYQKLLRGECPSTESTALMRKECFECCGLFDETLPSFVGYDFWLRVAQQYHFATIPEPLTIMYQHPGVRLTTDASPRKAGLEGVLSKWGPEICKYTGARGYQQLERYFLALMYVNVASQAMREARYALAIRAVQTIIKLQPTRLKMHMRLTGKLILSMGRSALRSFYSSFFPGVSAR